MNLYSLLISLFVILAANSFSDAVSNSRTATPQALPITTWLPVISDSIPDDEFDGIGLLNEVDDAGYPFVTLTITLPKQPFPDHFTINLDEVPNVQLATLMGLVGQSISFRYTTELTNALLNIEVDGKFLLEADTGVITANTSKVSGKLGADELTTGDIPGLLTITAPDGEITEFPFFITSELLEVNGTTVTAFYEERTKNTVKAITLPK